MTHKEMRMAIAEACPEIFRWNGTRVEWIDTDEETDPLDDLNAMQSADKHALEHVMDADQWQQYGRELHKIHPTAVVYDVHNPPEGIDWHDFATIMTTLTAAQRAEAFCRTLWPERFLTNPRAAEGTPTSPASSRASG